jgi:iron complex outermembrane receptor protein
MHIKVSSPIALALLSSMSQALYGGSGITGRIHDAGGQALKGVAITAGTKVKAFSDEKGEFTVEAAASAGKVRLLFELPGYYPETVLCELKDPSAPLDVVLTQRTIVREAVKVVASRLDISLASNPAATSVVGTETIDALPRGIGIDEPLQSVPGVKVDNQANGERVHLSIRGQGILSEHGIRGVQVLYDGISLNDPSGFSPDVYDVDWAGVEQVNVVRGPVAFLYGGGSAGGVIDVRTRGADFSPTHGGLWTEGGSNGFYKTRGEVSGSGSGVACLLSGSRTAGDGYREHTAFWGNNVYGRLAFKPFHSLRLSPFAMGTGFFNENAEGLNKRWGYPSAGWWTMPNPDALAFNEYQLTHRFTGGFNGEWEVTERQQVAFSFYIRRTAYKEPVPSSVEHRDLTAPGGSVQYGADLGRGRIRNRFSAGVDLDWQFTTDLRHPNLGNAKEGPAWLANADITQHRAGGYVMDRLSIGSKWTLLGSVRFDSVGNQLIDQLKAGGLNLSGSQDFKHATGRLGATWNVTKGLGLFASWGQGFLPPATEELYANPAALGGFNKSLVPATSRGEEVGARGSALGRLFWDVAFFRLDTKHDFERYRIDSRPLETFYGNAGQSRRYGLESSARWLPARRVTVTGAYTYSHFTYTNYSSLTYPGNLSGKDLPNCPRQQVFANASYEFAKTWVIGASTQAYSRGYVDPTNQTWSQGYGLLNARFSKSWRYRAAYGTFFLTGRNLTAKRYIAFTEPDPDGNSYQPGSGREVFGGIQIRR